MNGFLNIVSFILSALLLVAGYKEKDDKSTAIETSLVESSDFVKVDSIELNYRIEGTGIPCLVVGSAIYYPRTFSQDLRQHFQFIFADQTGFNLNTGKDDAKKLTLDTFIEDMEAVRKTLGLGKVAVLGHSIHGLFALEYARKYPQNTSHVIMIGTPPYAGKKWQSVAKESWESGASDERIMILKESWQNVTEETLNQLSPSDAFIKTYVTNGPRYWFDPKYDCSWLWEGVYVNREIANQIFGVIFSEYDLTKIPGQTRTPVFVAMGKYDYAVPYILWDKVKSNFQNWSFNLFEKSGHTPQLEEPALFDKKLIDWIKSNKK